MPRLSLVSFSPWFQLTSAVAAAVITACDPKLKVSSNITGAHPAASLTGRGSVSFAEWASYAEGMKACAAVERPRTEHRTAPPVEPRGPSSLLRVSDDSVMLLYW